MQMQLAQTLLIICLLGGSHGTVRAQESYPHTPRERARRAAEVEAVRLGYDLKSLSLALSDSVVDLKGLQSRYKYFLLADVKERDDYHAVLTRH